MFFWINSLILVKMISERSQKSLGPTQFAAQLLKTDWKSKTGVLCSIVSETVYDTQTFFKALQIGA